MAAGRPRLNPEFQIDAGEVAGGLGLETTDFRQLMEAGRITVLCERGTGEDAGQYRVSFYHGTKRARWLIDPQGNFHRDLLAPASRRPAHRHR